MPAIELPDERVLVEQFERTIAGRDCEVYVFAERYSGRPISRLFRKTQRHARHVRIEVPTRSGSLKRFHDREKGPYGGGELDTARVDHYQSVEEDAEDWIQQRRELASGV